LKYNSIVDDLMNDVSEK